MNCGAAHMLRLPFRCFRRALRPPFDPGAFLFRRLGQAAEVSVDEAVDEAVDRRVAWVPAPALGRPFCRSMHGESPPIGNRARLAAAPSSHVAVVSHRIHKPDAVSGSQALAPFRTPRAIWPSVGAAPARSADRSQRESRRHSRGPRIWNRALVIPPRLRALAGGAIPQQTRRDDEAKPRGAPRRSRRPRGREGRHR